MADITSRVTSVLLGDKHVLDLENRILNGALLISLIAHLILMVEALLQGFSMVSVAVLGIGIVLFCVLYLSARMKGAHTWSSTILLAIICSELLVDWFFLGGRGGSAISVLILLTGVIPGICSSGRQLCFGLAILLTTFLALVLGTMFYWRQMPMIQVTLENNLEHLFEAAIFSAALLSVSLMIVYSYRRQRKIAAQLNKELSEANQALCGQNEKLRAALQQVETLKGILPICATCNNMLTEDGTWVRFEKFISGKTGARFSHGICPDCLQLQDPELYRELELNRKL